MRKNARITKHIELLQLLSLLLLLLLLLQIILLVCFIPHPLGNLHQRIRWIHLYISKWQQATQNHTATALLLLCIDHYPLNRFVICLRYIIYKLLLHIFSPPIFDTE